MRQRGGSLPELHGGGGFRGADAGLRCVRQRRGGFELPGRHTHARADRHPHARGDRRPHANRNTRGDAYANADDHTDCHAHPHANPIIRGYANSDVHGHADRGADSSAVGARLRPIASPIRSLGARYPSSPLTLGQPLSPAHRSREFEII